MWVVFAIPVSLLMIVVGCHFGYMLCNDHPAAFLMGLVLARWTFLALKDLQDIADDKIDEPKPKHYKLTELEAMATIKEMLTYTSLGDRWWHIKDLNLDDGRLLAVVSFEEEYGRFSDMHFSKERIVGKTQIVLIVKVQPREPGVTVKLRFVVSATSGRRPATAVIKSIQGILDDALTLRSESKTPAVTEVAA
jgi:hypothetical protein